MGPLIAIIVTTHLYTLDYGTCYLFYPSSQKTRLKGPLPSPPCGCSLHHPPWQYDTIIKGQLDHTATLDSQFLNIAPDRPSTQPRHPTESPFAKATEPWGGRLFIPSSSNHDDALGIVDCCVLFLKAVSQSVSLSLALRYNYQQHIYTQVHLETSQTSPDLNNHTLSKIPSQYHHRIPLQDQTLGLPLQNPTESHWSTISLKPQATRTPNFPSQSKTHRGSRCLLLLLVPLLPCWFQTAFRAELSCWGGGVEESEQPFRTEDFRFHVLKSFFRGRFCQKEMIFYGGIDLWKCRAGVSRQVSVEIGSRLFFTIVLFGALFIIRCRQFHKVE